MDPIKDWFTLENLATLSTAAVALRLVVELTKDGIDKLFHGRFATQYYAMLWGAVIVYGAHAFLGKLNPQQAFVDLFNTFALVGVTKMMDLDK